MWDILEQMLLKWERQGESERIDVADNMSRLTLDTLALCAFSYRFNSFYHNEMHPYVKNMLQVLQESGARAERPALMNRLMFFKARQRAEGIRNNHQIADELIAQRKKQGNPPGCKDLLALMLEGKDPQTGRGLSDENIRFQMITFLTAGHETTSGLLTFTLYELLDNPACLAKARGEVDRVLGNQNPRFEHLSQLTYIDQVLKETLRLWPIASAFAVQPYDKETTIGGKYRVTQDQVILVFLPALHRDPKVWVDPERFDPERFAPGNVEKIPENAWKAFGNGQRACIGRPFALQEATAALAGILQRFEISKADPDYQLRIKEAATIKPEGFCIKAKRRNVVIASTAAVAAPAAQPKAVAAIDAATAIPLRVLFGSNSGSAEAFAQRIASDAKSHGYVSTLDTLDSAVGHLPHEGAVVIVTASYEGHPTDNAKQFVAWLEEFGAARFFQGREVCRVRLWQQGLGPHLPGHPETNRRAPPESRGRAFGSVAPARRTPAAISSVTSTAGMRPSGTRSGRRSARKCGRRCPFRSWSWSSSRPCASRSCARTIWRTAWSSRTASWWT